MNTNQSDMGESDTVLRMLPSWPEGDHTGWKWTPSDAGAPSPAKWVSPTTGYPCMIRRNTSGVWCGYVAIPMTHPFTVRYEDPREGESRLDIVDRYLSVHGGVTYHVMNDDLSALVLGFDCNHVGDRAPDETHSDGIPGAVYRDAVYVMLEVERLASQLAGYGAWSVNKLFNCGNACVARVKSEHSSAEQHERIQSAGHSDI